jgi:hypothetical protein
MRTGPAIALSFVLTGAVTFAGLRWPRQQPMGWLELDGRPVAVDGERVEDWRRVNEVLARSAAHFVTRIEDHRKDHTCRELLDREFAIDYLPRANAARAERVVVRRYLPTLLLWGGSHHPIAYARYEVVASAPGK